MVFIRVSPLPQDTGGLPGPVLLLKASQLLLVLARLVSHCSWRFVEMGSMLSFLGHSFKAYYQFFRQYRFQNLEFGWVVDPPLFPAVWSHVKCMRSVIVHLCTLNGHWPQKDKCSDCSVTNGSDVPPNGSDPNVEASDSSLRNHIHLLACLNHFIFIEVRVILVPIPHMARDYRSWWSLEKMYNVLAEFYKIQKVRMRKEEMYQCISSRLGVTLVIVAG